MPIPIEEITQALRGNEVGSTTYSAADGLMVVEGTAYRVIPKNTYTLPTHEEHARLVFPGNDMEIYVRASGVGPALTLRKQGSGNALIELYPDWGNGVVTVTSGALVLHQCPQNLFYGQVKTGSPGTGQYMFADGFIEHSSILNKDNVVPLETSNLLEIEPKEYDLAGKPTCGLVVEEVETKIPRAIHTTTDKDGKPHKGIALGAMISHILLWLRNFDARLKKIEGVK